MEPQISEAPRLTGSNGHPRPKQRWQRHRDGRPGRAPEDNPTATSNGDGQTRLTPLDLRPASVAPRSQESSSAENSSTETSTPRRPYGERGRGATRGGMAGGRGRGSAAGHSTNHATHQRHPVNITTTMTSSGRQFGGHLTTETESSAPLNSNSSLHGGAPEFRPGQAHIQRPSANRRGRAARPPQNRTNEQTPRPRRGSIAKSAASDIATRTHEDIANGVYECPICTSEVARSSKVWSCKTCWTVFHLTCIKKWSQNEGSAVALQNGEMPLPRQWRCPGCNLPKDVLPSTYSCWCEKEVDPRQVHGLPPHSCGQTCGKHRVLPRKCPHPCELPCHAGPCPPCAHMGPTQICFCGKKSVSRRCVDTNYDTGWSCGEVCGDLMLCGEHTCDKPCHEGLCGACEVRIDGRCYCGQVEKTVICCERGDERDSKRALYDENGDRSEESWTGIFDCENVCGRPYDCGKHSCEKQCHTQDPEPSHCPRAPDIVSNCPCGKTQLTEISDTPRNTCEDPIPNCQKECSKKLPCGHLCRQICHSGRCDPCFERVSISCRCGRTTSLTICHQGSEEKPQCMRTCKVTMNCGRHECGEHCCLGERKAAERQATKRKLRPLGTSRVIDDGFEPEHICTRLCGRTLKCGNHTCPELCHKGPCASCREAIFDEISCHCGKTVLQPPLPCGTTPPPCRFNCERPKLCSHPQIPHNCHGDQESCPKCPFLVEKPCMCGKKTLKNQQCWLADVRCGDVCGRRLKCGSHYCRKQCHRPGECESAGKACQQACGKAKKICGHPCEEQCHAPSSCREDKACQNKILITCDCQHLKQEMKCNASKTTEGNLQKSLKCDNECARLERNRKLALALNIDPEAHKDDHVPYSTTTLQMFQESVKWAQSQEREFRVFAADSPEKRLRFKPMPPHQRAFLHALAEDFGFDSESMDPEPHRHVVAFKTPRFVMAPMKTLAECVRIRTSAAASEAATIADAQKKLHASNEPYNGFLFTTPRFGLTIEELRADLAPTLDSALGIAFVISFLPSEEIVVKAHPASSATSISTSAIEAALKTLKPALVSATASKTLAGSVSLCLLDPSLNILRREADSAAGGTATDGWSRVAAKAASGMRFAPRKEDVGGRNLYTVLGSKAREKKKREEEEEARRESVVEDWEEAVRLEEAEAKVEVEEEEAKAEEAESVELGPANGENKTWLETSEVAAVDTRS